MEPLHIREMAIAILRAHPSKKTLPLKQQATLDPNFRLGLLANIHAKPCASIIRRISVLADRTIPV